MHSSPGPHRRPGMDHFVNLFKDPPNVDELLASVRPPPTSTQAYRHMKLSVTLYTEDRFTFSSLQMGDDSTRERAFLAALYLKNRHCMEDTELETWCKNVHFNRLGHIAREIRYTEPRLQGFTPRILLEHHQCLIQHWRDLEEGLQAGAYPDWVPTHFSSIARELSILEDNNGFFQSRLNNMETYLQVRETRFAKELQRLECQMEEIEQQQLARARINKAVPIVAHTRTKDGEFHLAATTQSEQGETIADALIKIENQGSNGWMDQSRSTASPNGPSPSQALTSDEFFVNIFKDPPNVNELLASVLPPPTSIQAFEYIQVTRPRLDVKDFLSRSDIRMGDDSTRENAFIAALYLKNRLGLGEMELRTWCGRELHKRLNRIVKEIICTEPRLQVFHVSVLLEHHQCVIKYYRDLQEGLQAGAYPDWTPTHFSNIARELSILEDDKGLIRLREQNLEESALSWESWKTKIKKKLLPHMEQKEQPRQLDKGKIDEVMITIALAMARNDHGVPIMVPALDWDQGELFLTELVYEGEDKDEVPVSMQPLPVNSTQPDHSRATMPSRIPNVSELLAPVHPPPVSVQATFKNEAGASFQRPPNAKLMEYGPFTSYVYDWLPRILFEMEKEPPGFYEQGAVFDLESTARENWLS
ncbi:MAG: hypothetical protein J3Q66DRAFT_445182 [Benniella sp.]|nr:MAG: hypothetical protein J3Q66DRAFT_445182 [Benniella sp.]